MEADTFDPGPDGKCKGDEAEHWRICNAEHRAWMTWVKAHREVCILAAPELGFGTTGNQSVMITPGMIGAAITAVCDCGAKQDITHMDHW